MSERRFPVEAFGQAVADGAVLDWLSAADVDVVHAGLFDTSGTLREKRLSAPAAARALQDGWSFIDAVEWWTPDDRVWRDGGSQHHEVALDPTSGRFYPFEPAAALVLGDFTGPLGDLSPRVLLARMVERASRVGLEAEVGWEFECIVLDQRPEELDGAAVPRPAMTTNRCWSALTPAVAAETLGQLTALLESGGIPIDHLCAELGPGCLELATARAPALRSADDAALAKLYTKAFFARRSQTATFMAQLGEDFPGLGGHPTMSLRWSTDGRPALPEPSGALSKVAGAAVAGVLALLPSLMVMLAPNPNSYRRYAPGNWATRTATWGLGNYSTGLRAVTGGPEATRLELRIPGADVDPHLALAMFLGAAIWGVEGGLHPPEPVVAPHDGRLAQETSPLPRTLGEAIEQFLRGPATVELFGSRFAEHYAASRVVEDEACRRFVPAGERQRYLHQV